MGENQLDPDNMAPQFKEKAKFLYDMLNLEGKKLLIHMYLSQCVQSGVPKEKCASMIEYLTGYNPLVGNVEAKEIYSVVDKITGLDA